MPTAETASASTASAQSVPVPVTANRSASTLAVFLTAPVRCADRTGAVETAGPAQGRCNARTVSVSPPAPPKPARTAAAPRTAPANRERPVPFAAPAAWPAARVARGRAASSSSASPAPRRPVRNWGMSAVRIRTGAAAPSSVASALPETRRPAAMASAPHAPTPARIFAISATTSSVARPSAAVLRSSIASRRAHQMPTVAARNTRPARHPGPSAPRA